MMNMQEGKVFRNKGELWIICCGFGLGEDGEDLSKVAYRCKGIPEIFFQGINYSEFLDELIPELKEFEKIFEVKDEKGDWSGTINTREEYEKWLKSFKCQCQDCRKVYRNWLKILHNDKTGIAAFIESLRCPICHVIHSPKEPHVNTTSEGDIK